MPATKRFMNWTAVTFTPAGNGAQPIVITGVTSIAIDSGGSIAKFSGDGDRYNTVLCNDFNEPSITVTTADIGAINALPSGTLGTIAATHNDVKNGTGTGAITYSMVGIVDKENRSGKHRAFGEGSISFMGYSADGQTNPLSTSVAT